jgi:outer membrane protein
LLVASPWHARATDLLETYRLALVNDAAYRSAGADFRATQQVRPQAISRLLPNLDVRLATIGNRLKVRKSNAISSVGTQTFNTKEYEVSLSQPVYRHELWIQLEQADSRIKQATAQYSFAEQDLILRVAERYFNVLRALDELAFSGAEKEANRQQLEQSKQRFEVGLIAITDVEEAKAGFDSAVAQEIAAENALDNARERLREITGVYYQSLAPLGVEMPLVLPEPGDIEKWTETALRRNLEVAAARFQAEVAEEEIRRIKAQGHEPKLDVVGDHLRRDAGGGFSGPSDVDTSTISLELSVPIYQGGLVLSQTREARERYRETLDDLEQRQRAVQRQAREAFLGLLSGISRVKALNQAVASNEASVAATEAGFQVGTRTSVDVLVAQRALFRANSDYAGSRYDFVLNLVRLKQAAGSLAENDLITINAWLE